MGILSAISVLRGARLQPAIGLTWVPADALRSLAFHDEVADPAQTLAAVASALGLDAVLVPAREPWAARAVEQLLAIDVAVIWAVDGVMTRVSRRWGWSEAIKASASEPGALAIAIAEGLHDALEEARRGIGLGATALLVADDLAGDSGWLISPDFALDALVPCYRSLAGVGDWPVGFHSDGDVRALYASLATAGFQAVHVAVGGAVPTATAFAAARGHGLVPMGGIEAKRLFSHGARAAGEEAAELAAGGPALICDDGGLASGEELAAYASAIEAAKRTSP